MLLPGVAFPPGLLVRIYPSANSTYQTTDFYSRAGVGTGSRVELSESSVN